MFNSVKRIVSIFFIIAKPYFIATTKAFRSVK